MLPPSMLTSLLCNESRLPGNESASEDLDLLGQHGLFSEVDCAVGDPLASIACISSLWTESHFHNAKVETWGCRHTLTNMRK